MKKFLTILFSFAIIITAFGAKQKLKVGDAAPDFTLSDIRTGEDVSLSSFRGQVVVMQLWKTN